jgi:FkbM family methyltransferase
MYESISYIVLPNGAKLHRDDTIFKREMILLDIIGQELVSPVKGTRAEIEFLKHSYSGVVEICAGESSTTIDLFSETHTKINFAIDIPPNATYLTIKVLDNLSLRSEGSNPFAKEVWIGKIRFNNPFTPDDIMVNAINESLSLINGKYGSYMLPNTDVGVSRTIMHEGVWAGHDVNLFFRFIKPGMTVYEVGGHIGHHSVVFSRLCGREGKVHVFEPQNYLFKVLNSNLLINGCNNATAHRLALGNERSKAKLWPIDYTQDNNFGGLSISQKAGEKVLNHSGEEITIITGDEFVADLDNGNSSVDFIKIDAQFYELYVLQGLINTLKNKRPILFLEVEPYCMQLIGYHYSEIFKLLYGLNYKLYLPHESLEKPIEGIPEWDVKDKTIACDILALPA